MEVKKKAEITVGSVVRVVKVKQPFEKRFLGRIGVVVSVVKGVVLDCGADSLVQERIRVQIDRDFFWCDEDQVQLVTPENQKVPEPEATAHKFKVGDTVRVTNNHPAHLSRSSDDVLWISAMNRYCGRIHRIVEVRERGYILNGPWDILFSEEWLEPASPDKPKSSPKRTIVIEITDNGAEAKYIVGKNIEKTASVKRYKGDKPDDRLAAHYVIGKLFGQKVTKDNVDMDALKSAKCDCMIARYHLDKISKVLDPFGEPDFGKVDFKF